MHISFKISVFSSNKHPGVEMMDHMVALFLTFWGNSILFFTVAAPICIPTNSAWEFPFLHILVNTCYLLFVVFLITAILTGAKWLWCWFAFLSWLVMLSIFSCACWQSMSSLESCLFRPLTHFFQIGLFVFWCWVV